MTDEASEPNDEQRQPDTEPEQTGSASSQAASEAGEKAQTVGEAQDDNASDTEPPAGSVVPVRAQARYVRCAPRKARLVMEHIRGKPVDEARSILAHSPRRASRDVLKLLESAIANAENNHALFADDLTIENAYADEGPTLKRYRPRALGRATRIDKRTSHMTITLSTKE